MTGGRSGARPSVRKWDHQTRPRRCPVPFPRELAAAGTARLPRGTLDAESILDAALVVIDDLGVEEFSVPALARHLAVGPTAIYWHYKRKEDLLAALSLRAVQQFNAMLPPVDATDWQREVHTYWTEFRRILRERPALLDLVVLRWADMARVPDAVALSYRRIDAQLAVLIDAGFSPEAAARAYHLLSTYCRGCLLNERASTTSGRSAALNDRSLTSLGADLDELPAMRAVAPYWTFTFSTSADYEAGLSTIIAGLVAELGG